MLFFAYPFIRYLSGLVAGILFWMYCPCYGIDFKIPLVIVCAVYILLFFIVAENKKSNFKSIFGSLAIIILFLLGLFLSQLWDYKTNSSHIYNTSDKIEAYTGFIDSEIEEKDNVFKCEVKIDKARLNGQWKFINGRILVYFKKSAFNGELQYGNYLLIGSNTSTIQAPLNPSEFNLKQYYSYKRISHQHFLTLAKYKKLYHQPANYILFYSIQIRSEIGKIFKKYIHSERERNVASALIMGIRNQLDSEIKNAYSATGTMHSLAVSGLHVGFIYKILLFITGFLRRIKRGLLIQAVLLIIVLIGYAFITGLCPSILRAVLMFIVIIIAKASGRSSSIYNSIAISAFILLCVNPFYLTDIGFQLSYLAVVGIVFIHSYIYPAFESKNKLIQELWEITSVSIAAQLATFPLSLLYFHQFPNCFLFSNLVVIPIANGIMYAGLLFLAISWIPLAGLLLGWIIEKMVFSLNWIVINIESIPYSSMQGISISILQCLLIYGFIYAFMMLLMERRFQYVVYIFIFSMCYVVIEVIKTIQYKNQNALIVYQIKDHSAIDFINGKNFFSFEDSVLKKKPSKIQFHILNNRIKRGLTESSNATFKDMGFFKLIVWKGKRIAILDKYLRNITFREPIALDYLVVQNNAVKSLDYLFANFRFKTAIFDGSNKKYLVNKLLDNAGNKSKYIYETFDKGAFELNF